MANIIRRIFTLKCPRCGKGDLFLNKNPFVLKQLVDMPNRCPSCGQDFIIETGFYWGAYYISYMLGVAFCLPCLVVLLFLFHIPFGWALTLTILLYLLITPITTRWSRAVWLAIFHNQKNW